MHGNRLLCSLLLLPLAGVAGTSGTDPTAPFHDFAMADGALTVFAHGDYVEPYSAVKALIIAHRLGVDVQDAANAFTDWILPFQQANGPFPKICRSGGNRWLACGPADADDSMAVLWCAMTVELLPKKRSLDASCQRALDNLATLWEPKQGTFRAMFAGEAAYFANNVEVIAFLKSLRQNKLALMRLTGVLAKLPAHKLMVDSLSQNYGYDPDRALEPQRASVPATPYAFYPYGVAPIYPMIYNMRSDGAMRRDWSDWKARYGSAWQAGTLDHFPWGLAALAAYKAADYASAHAWLDRAPSGSSRGAGTSSKKACNSV